MSLGTTLTGVSRYNLIRQWLNLVLSFYSRLGRTTVVVEKLLVVTSSSFYLEIIFRRYVLGLIFTIQRGIVGMHFNAEGRIFCTNYALNSAVLYARIYGFCSKGISRDNIMLFWAQFISFCVWATSRFMKTFWIARGSHKQVMEHLVVTRYSSSK